MIFLISLSPIVFALPTATAFFARSLGRNFWLWFGLAFFLPIIAFTILWFLDAKKGSEEKTA